MGSSPGWFVFSATKLNATRPVITVEKWPVTCTCILSSCFCSFVVVVVAPRNTVGITGCHYITTESP